MAATTFVVNDIRHAVAETLKPHIAKAADRKKVVDAIYADLKAGTEIRAALRAATPGVTLAPDEVETFVLAAETARAQRLGATGGSSSSGPKKDPRREILDRATPELGKLTTAVEAVEASAKAAEADADKAVELTREQKSLTNADNAALQAARDAAVEARRIYDDKALPQLEGGAAALAAIGNIVIGVGSIADAEKFERDIGSALIALGPMQVAAKAAAEKARRNREALERRPPPPPPPPKPWWKVFFTRHIKPRGWILVSLVGAFGAYWYVYLQGGLPHVPEWAFTGAALLWAIFAVFTPIEAGRRAAVWLFVAMVACIFIVHATGGGGWSGGSEGPKAVTDGFVSAAQPGSVTGADAGVPMIRWVLLGVLGGVSVFGLGRVWRWWNYRRHHP